ncbi:uncharacterized protein LOC143453027 [Clavelina lepadiformis]|uniref:uncharacterized protein LOC143453027 n=1 Tax=Clavelina lepadiformis TaxID=159417 RepID=UPI0040418986
MRQCEVYGTKYKSYADDRDDLNLSMPIVKLHHIDIIYSNFRQSFKNVPINFAWCTSKTNIFAGIKELCLKRIRFYIFTTTSKRTNKVYLVGGDIQPFGTSIFGDISIDAGRRLYPFFKVWFQICFPISN